MDKSSVEDDEGDGDEDEEDAIPGVDYPDESKDDLLGLKSMKMSERLILHEYTKQYRED